MARDWRRAVLAAVAAAMLGGACVLAAQAQAAEEEPEGEQAEAAADAQPGKSGKKRQDPAEAQRAIEAAQKQLQAGRTEQAVQGLTAVLSGGNLPPAILARAFYVRGMAYRQQRRTAQAVSDLTSALWLKGGLGGEERDAAIRERSAAYADAGLADRGEAEAPAPKTSGSWLSGLFGSSSEPPPQRRPAPPSAAKTEPAAPAPAAALGGWATTSRTQAEPAQVERPAPAQRSVAAAPAPPPRTEAPRAPPPSARTEGRYQVQLAAVRTEAEAYALAAKAKREAALASREPWIDHTVIGNMGAFYRVRFGPFASAQETQAVCTKLQGSGFDCMPVGP
jgi:cell division septation protein DedD